MDVAALLAELDTYLLARGTPVFKRDVSANVKAYQVRGVYLRDGDIVEEHDILYLVYEEGEPAEAAYYTGDVINSFWTRKLIDYMHSQNWSARVLRAKKPFAVVYALRDPGTTGYEWLEIEENPVDTWNVTIITGDVQTGW